MPDRPLCKCHGEPMHQNGHTRGRRKNWVCSVKNRKRGRDRYQNDPEYAARKRAAGKAYKKTAPGQLSELLHQMSRVQIEYR